MTYSDFTSIVHAVVCFPAHTDLASGVYYPTSYKTVERNLTYTECLDESEHDSGHTLHTVGGALYATYGGVHVGWIFADGTMANIDTVSAR
jgi:hypothetical protein